MKLSEFYDMLEKHDWFYHMSDDHRYYSAGVVVADKIRAITGKDPDCLKLYLEYQSYMLKRGEKPARPED